MIFVADNVLDPDVIRTMYGVSKGIRNITTAQGSTWSDLVRGHSTIDTFQDFLISEHMKPCMHILEISISSLNHVFIRPTKTPKLADKKFDQF